MSELVIIAYPDENRAAEVVATLRRMQAQDQLELDDAAAVSKDKSGRLLLHPQEEVTLHSTRHGHFWRSLHSLLFEPDSAVDAYVDAAGQRFSDIGIDQAYISSLGQHMQPGSSAALILIRAATISSVLPAVASFGGDVLRTSLPPEQEAQLRAALKSPSDVR
jgi:uncharacterized membrane protein